jgi:hypothetical protein
LRRCLARDPRSRPSRPASRRTLGLPPGRHLFRKSWNTAPIRRRIRSLPISGLPFPNSLARLLDTTATRHAPGDGSVVTFDFDAVNGLGFPLRMQAECAFDGRSMSRLQVTPRWDAAAADQSVFSIPPSTK